ncbi:unnamed protein product [Adineta steineri]|uniref:Uncharacterized protein n=1 Tax=Adineta steineri TaxID=433720 RepID=A0A818JZZ8_9BILA|nr:unnamed protein product [Adineta steineri]CAF0946060.1 unnamed protein product [Adineta steineri]CAF3499902.1 unnamed protein product [Adineta steineri]CAF3550292.1 unnamed protein product [Adineta steineri]
MIDSNPIQQYIRKYDDRSRRSLDIRQWQFVDTLYKHFYKDDSYRNDGDREIRQAEASPEFGPVHGPISIEQLPAMLAARHVKRYPFSQDADPDIIGR